MHLAEIIVLIAGAVLFTVSFFMPDKGEGSARLDEEEEKKAIRELLEKEVDNAKYQIEEATQECVNENRDRMERALDRITNEKMSAVDEYSNTVLDQIHKNHDEVMFLYDMLNNKHTQVKNTAAELNQIAKSAKVAVETPVVEKPVEVKNESKAVAEKKAETDKKEANLEKGFGYVSPSKAGTAEGEGFGYTTPSTKNETFDSVFEELPVEKVELEVLDINKELKTSKKKSTKVKTDKVPVADGNIDLMFASDNNSANNNDRILALHKEGKSNMAIAKELGLGIGEVKLVIDLFEGI